MRVTLHCDGMVSVSDGHSVTYACTEDDSNDFLEWFIGTTDRNVFENRTVFNSNGELIELVREDV